MGIVDDEYERNKPPPFDPTKMAKRGLALPPPLTGEDLPQRAGTRPTRERAALARADGRPRGPSASAAAPGCPAHRDPARNPRASGE